MPFVFGYGSLVDRESVEATLGRALDPRDGPHPARLVGFRRTWNVLGHSGSRPEYAFVDDAGAPWEGWLAFLGVEPSPGTSTLGAVVRLDAGELAAMDDRERSYDRVDVAGLLDREVPGRTDEPVFVYRPKADVVAGAAGADGVVMARYLRLVDRAYRALGDELYAEHLATFPDPAPLAVREITVRPLLPGARNQAVDPGRAPR